MILLNFSHPLTDDQVDQLAALLGATPAIRTISAHFDHSQLFVPQVAALADAAGLSPDKW